MIPLYTRMRKIELFLDRDYLPDDIRRIFKGHLLRLNEQRTMKAKERNLESEAFFARLGGVMGIDKEES